MTHPSITIPRLAAARRRAAVLPPAHLSGVSDSAAAALYVPGGEAYSRHMPAPSWPGLGALAVALSIITGGASIAPSARAGDYDDALRAGVAARDRARDSQFVSDWQLAFEQFEHAVAVDDTAAARFELAEAAGALGRVDLAYESYEIALAGGLSGKAAAVARAYLDAHAANIARVEVAAPAGTALSVDGRARGRLPLARPLVVPAGQVTIGLAPPDGAAWEQTLDLEPGELRHITLARAPLAGGAPAPEGASVGAAMALAPTHVERKATGVAADPAESEASEQPAWLGRHPGAIALLSVAGVSVAAGGWFAYKAHDSDQEVQDTRSQIEAALEGHVDGAVINPSAVPCGSNGIASGVATFGPGVSTTDQQTLVSQYASACQLFDERQERTERYTTLSMVGFGVGLAASAAVVIWYIASPSDDAPGSEARRALVVPLLSADTQGVLVEVAF